MKKIGLTGGIGMGKSTTAALFAEAGVPVWDADRAVHRLYAPNGAAVAPILERFPGAGGPKGGVNRAMLAEQVLGDPEALKDLEAIVHPLVELDQAAFMQHHMDEGADFIVFDVPLLLETGDSSTLDIIVVCSAPEEVRKARVMERPGMTEENYNAIVSRQMPNSEKIKHADYVVPTGEGIDMARDVVHGILADLRESRED